MKIEPTLVTQAQPGPSPLLGPLHEADAAQQLPAGLQGQLPWANPSLSLIYMILEMARENLDMQVRGEVMPPALW